MCHFVHTCKRLSAFVVLFVPKRQMSVWSVKNLRQEFPFKMSHETINLYRKLNNIKYMCAHNNKCLCRQINI